MSSYNKLIDWVKNETNFNLSEINNKSKELLKLCLINKKFEFVNLFDNNIWDKELIDLYYENKPKELTYIDINTYDTKLKQYNITKLLNFGFHSYVMTRYISSLNEDLYLLFLNTLKISDLDYYTMQSAYAWYDQELIKTVIKNKQFELVAAILNKNCWNDECLELLSGNMIELHNTVSFYSARIPEFIFEYNGGKLLTELIENNIFDWVNYYNKDKYLSNEENIRILIKKFKDFPIEKYLFRTYYANDILLNRKDFLKTVLEVNNEKYINHYINMFAPTCWTMENQILYYKLIEEGYDYPKSNVPYVLYKDAYKNNHYSYLHKTYFNKEYDNKTLKNDNEIYSIGEYVSTEGILKPSPFEKMCLLVYNTKSTKILNLMRFLMEMDIANADKLFDDNGMTDYLISYLAFDPDYILYCVKSGNENDLLDKINSSNYATYTMFLVKYPEISKYLLVDKNNVNEYFKSKKVTKKFFDKMYNKNSFSLLLKMYEENELIEISEIIKYILLKTKEISEENVKKSFIEFCINNNDTLSKEDIDKVAILIKKVEYSNSIEIRNKSADIVNEMLHYNNPELKLKEIEDIFIEDNIPEFGKRFYMYKLLYSQNKDLNTNSSPILLKSSDKDIDKIILFDLFKVSLGTFNQDLLLYLDELKKEDNIFSNLKLRKANATDLSPEELLNIKKLNKKLQFFASHVFKLDYEKFEDDYTNLLSIEHAIKDMVNYPKMFPLFSLTDIIIKELFGNFGFNSYIQLYTYAYTNLISKTAIEEGRHLHQKELVIKDGDLIKGIQPKFLNNILEYGSLCKELLGEDATRDLTHLDTDLSVIRGNGLSIKDILASNIDANNFGDVKLLLSREDIDKISPIIETRNESGEIPYDIENISKTELFQVKKNSTHYAIRSGFPISYIRAIITDKNIKRIKFLIVKKGFFIPIYNSNGDLLFSYEEYLELSKQRQGLSHYYEENKYEISNNLESENINKEVDNLYNNVNDANIKRNAIYNQLLPIFNKYFKEVKYELDDSITNGVLEIFDTGSTGRGTNMSNDSDFDFIIRVDREFKLNSELFNNFIKDIYSAFNINSSITPIRLTDVKVNGINEPLKIDINPIVKNNKITYATVDCVKDRLQNIKRLYPEKYDLVIANIIYAKKILKEAEAYKSSYVRNPQGGLGGIGVETWILQHGGSLYDAAVSFLEISDKVNNFNDFKKLYSIFDFGKDHMSEEWNKNKKNKDFSYGDFAYDDFVDNMDSNGYEKMKIVLKNFVNTYNQNFVSKK